MKRKKQGTATHLLYRCNLRASVFTSNREGAHGCHICTGGSTDKLRPGHGVRCCELRTLPTCKVHSCCQEAPSEQNIANLYTRKLHTSRTCSAVSLALKLLKASQ